jgi:DnaJ-class molecular chaperone
VPECSECGCRVAAGRKTCSGPCEYRRRKRLQAAWRARAEWCRDCGRYPGTRCSRCHGLSQWTPLRESVLRVLPPRGRRLPALEREVMARERERGRVGGETSAR